MQYPGIYFLLKEESEFHSKIYYSATYKEVVEMLLT